MSHHTVHPSRLSQTEAKEGRHLAYRQQGCRSIMIVIDSTNKDEQQVRRHHGLKNGQLNMRREHSRLYILLVPPVENPSFRGVP